MATLITIVVVICILIPGAVTLSHHSYGQGSGLIFLINIGCNGTEFSLLECSHSISHFCDRSTAIAVECSTRTIIKINYTTFKLIHNIEYTIQKFSAMMVM